MKRDEVTGTVAVWFSCGAASAVAAKKTIEIYGDRCDIRILNTPIAEEDADNQRFLRDIEQWLGVKIEKVINPNWPDSSCIVVWDGRKFMSGVAGAPCTLELKKRARQIWEKDNPTDWLVLGFTAEEKHRADRFIKQERDCLLPILIDCGISKEECFKIVADAGIDLPRVYHLGYPNANCIGCVKATSPTYWNHVRKQNPEVFAERAEQSRRLGAKLVRVKGERIFLDELPEDAKGAPLKSMQVDCGLFCVDEQGEQDESR